MRLRDNTNSTRVRPESIVHGYMKRPLDNCSWCGTGLLLTLKTVGTKPPYTKHSMRALADISEPHTVIQQNIPKVSGWAICAYQ